MQNILEHNKDLTTTEVTMKMPDKSCRRSLITANGSVQQMWDTIKDRVIGLRNDHVPTIQTGGRKWKSNYPHDKEVLDLIRENPDSTTTSDLRRIPLAEHRQGCTLFTTSIQPRTIVVYWCAISWC